MKQKKIILIIFIITILVSIISFIIVGDNFGFCIKNGVNNNDCISQINDIGEPTFLSFLSLFLITPILFFVHREVFFAWAKFAGIGFFFMISILLYTYNNTPTQDGFGLAGLISDEMLASILLPPLFFLISLLIIGIKSWKLRRK